MTNAEHNHTSPQEQRDLIEALDRVDRGKGEYPTYGYLWHLSAAGVVEVSAGADGDYVVNGTVWQGLYDTPAKIALIDTGVADHPNLRGRLRRDLGVDFGSDLAGAVYRGAESWADVMARWGSTDEPPAADARPTREPRGRLPKLDSADNISALLAELNLALEPAAQDALCALLVERTAKGVTIRDLDAQDQRYPSHGTATAGMIVGAPIMDDDGGFEETVFPYFGVDPFSELVPIATSFEPEPLQLTLALLYAYSIGVDVIHVPRGMDNPGRPLRPDPRPDPMSTRYGSHGDAWLMFEAVIAAVSKRIPVVCAAGNIGDDRLSYPAQLTAPDNGIIAVGAVTAVGRRAGYASYGEGLTLVAPSNDSIVYNKHQIRLDHRARGAVSHRWTIHHRLDGGYLEYSPVAPLSVDVPGARGFRGGVGSTEEGDVRRDYTLFGGTSAASAIVAGVAGLMRRAVSCSEATGGTRWNGMTVKDALVASAASAIGTHALRPDVSNRSDTNLSPVELKTANFGAGLVNAQAAIAHIKRAPGAA